MIDKDLLADLKASQEEEGENYTLADLIAVYGDNADEGAEYFQALQDGKKNTADSPQNTVQINLDNSTTPADNNQDSDVTIQSSNVDTNVTIQPSNVDSDVTVQLSNVDTDVTVQSSNTPPAENVIPVEVQRNITKLPLDDRRGLSMTILEKYHCGYDLKTRRIFIPTVLPDDNLSYVAVLTKSARKELDAKGTEYKKVKAGNGTRGIFNLNNISADSPVFITEGEIDALSIIEAGYENVIAVGGQSVGNLIDWLNKNPAKFQFLVLFDNDDSGKKAAPKAIKNLIENGYPAVSNFLAVSADKVDANDLLLAGQDLLKNRIEQILAEAKLEFEKPAAQVTEVIKPPTKKKSKRKKISSCFESYITIDEMKGMLEKINVESLSYDEWALTVGGGLVNWGTINNDLDTAFNLFNQFSAQDTRPKKYSESGCMSQWDNLVKGESKEKKRSVQHLIDLAKQYGYVVPDPIPDSIAKVLSKGTDPDDDLARAVKVFAFADNTLRYVADADCWATYDGVKWNFTPKSNAPAVYPYVYRMVQAIRQSLKNGRAYRDFDDFFNKKKIDAAISLMLISKTLTQMTRAFCLTSGMEL